MHIKKGDTVFIITGKDRGKTGKVLRVAPQEGRILVEGIASQIRHRKRRQKTEKGQRVAMPAFIPASNAQVICASCGKRTRVGFQVAESGKIRVCKRCKAPLS